jgi:predicted nucleic acid-binding protein
MNKDIVVVDANIAVKWAVMEEDSHIAERLLTEWNLQSTRIIVPALFLYEISNILWKKVRRDVLAFSRAKQAMKFILDTGIETYCSVDKEVNLRALDLANTINCRPPMTRITWLWPSAKTVNSGPPTSVSTIR